MSHPHTMHPQDKKPSKAALTVARASGALRADADMQAVLDALLALDPLAIEKCTPDEARRNPTPSDAVQRLLRQRGTDPSPTSRVADVQAVDRRFPGAAGELAMRVYTPQAPGPLPVVLYFHGGGWVIADIDSYDGGARALSREAAAIVVSCDYRRAPEHRFPAAWDDALAAYRWVLAHAASLGGDPARVALAGESAGGTLAMATAIAARDAGLPLPHHILSIYPVAQTGSLHTASYLENALAQPLNRAMMGWFFDHLFARDEDRRDPRIDLMHADLRGLPPVTIINAMLDPLRSDGALLEDELLRAGVEVDRRDYHGVTHEFFGMGAVVQKAREAQSYAGQRLRDAFVA